MGYVNDLADTVVKQLNITTFPTLVVLKYNFEEEINEMYRYPGKELDTDHYEEIKTFLEALALKEPRNDILYHKMKMIKESNIQTTDSTSELAEMLDRSNGWVMI